MKSDVVIIPVEDHETYTVNGKEIFKDTNGNYIARHEMTTSEKAGFNLYKRTVIDNPNFKKHTRATYKI